MDRFILGDFALLFEGQFRGSECEKITDQITHSLNAEIRVLTLLQAAYGFRDG